MRRLRTISTIAGALLATALVAPPVGAFHLAVEDEPTGEWTVNDSNGLPGVTCKFENNGGTQNDELNRINIRQLWTHGDYPQKTWVGFRFLVKANRPPLSDGKFRTVFRSPIQKKKANDTDIATFSGGWNAPEGSRSRYRVHIFFYYYEPGSRTKKEGFVRGLMEIYRHKMNGAMTYDLGSEGDPRYCGRNFHNP